MQDDGVYLDTYYDDRFEAAGLRWLPWVGRTYRASPSRTIVLGESIYDYSKGDVAVRERILGKHSLRQRQLAHGIHEKHKSRYLRNFARAFFGKAKVGRADRQLLWQQVVYHNLVPRMMEARGKRPSEQDYLNGWRKFFVLATMVEARRCVVYGLETVKINALKLALPDGAQAKFERLPAVGKNRPLKLTMQLNGQLFELLFIRHPSAFFRWGEWAVVLRDFLGDY